MRVRGAVAGVLACVALAWASLAQGAEQLIRYPAGVAPGDFRYAYPVRMLQLALDKTAHEYGPARATQAPQPMTTARIMAELGRGELLDVASFPAEHGLAQQFVPVPICIRKGILGIRLLLIDGRRQAEFSAIHDLAGLKKLTAGQGRDWVDTRILQGNGFKVETTASYEGLFAMLMSGRFDFFPRGVYEPFMEVQQHAQQMPHLALEKTLALYYPSPDFFWVRKGNEALAERLRKGLEAAVADGSYEKLFQREFAETIRTAHLDQRRILQMDNPEYKAMPHAGDARYWLADQQSTAKSRP